MGTRAVLFVFLFSCSGSHRVVEPRSDADVSDADVDMDADESGDRDGDIGDPASVPNCGDGVLDPEEECDDHNRLNGDGCDWVCRLGDGPPTPDPDPDTPQYVPATPEEPSDGAAWSLDIPLQWNGAGVAAALFEPTPYDRPEEADTHIRFLEATNEGVIGGSDWNYPIPAADGTEGEGIRLDLVWNGEGYGLFYTSPSADEVPWRGSTDLWFLELDETGKPLGVPVLVTASYMITSLAAVAYEQGYAVAWAALNDRETDCWMGYGLDLGSLTVQAVARDGSSAGLPPPLIVSEDVLFRPSIAAGDDGFGISMVTAGTEADPSCSAAFVRLSSGFDEIATSGVLANALQTDAEFDGQEYVVAVAHWASADREYPPGELCVARYTNDGMLSSPPVCNGAFSEYGLDLYHSRNPSLAIGDDGLAVLLTAEFHIIEGMEETYPRLFFFRTDLSGRQVASPLQIDRSQMLTDASIVWTGDGFTSLHARSDGDGEASTSTLVFNRFTREE